MPREDAPRRVAERLKLAKDVLARYDKDKNGKLSPAEIGLPKEVFDRYDADKDGEWTALELLRWMIFDPDVETVVRLGQVPDKDGLLDLVPTPASAVAVHRTAVNAASVGMDDALISLIRGGGRRLRPADRRRLPGLRPAVPGHRQGRQGLHHARSGWPAARTRPCMRCSRSPTATATAG